ncbi:MAG: hypothetical protein JNM62_05570 [Flavobacteriales bacterium]|nr:hypothetical protein [Flavobacteriales bacterium]
MKRFSMWYFLGCAAVVLLPSTGAFGQMQPGLSLLPFVESGGTFYLHLPSENIHARADQAGVYFGLDIEVRKGPKFGYRFGMLSGSRGYVEEYQRAGRYHTLDHRVAELGWRFYVAQALRSNSSSVWELNYGLRAFPRIRSTINVSTSLGESVMVRTSEAASFGFMVGATRSSSAWLHGKLRVGVMVDLQIASAQPYLEVPWVNYDNLWVGGSRLFIGVALSYRVVRMQWTNVPE